MNLMDYITWRGDLTVDRAPLTQVDHLIMANLIYNDLRNIDWPEGGLTLQELVPLTDLPKQTGNIYFEQWRELFFTMAAQPRYREMRVRDYVDVTDEEKGIQFAAATFDMGDVSYIAYRGTDASIVGWYEDFCLAFESPVPAQQAAVDYLTAAAAKTGNKLVLTGHSKGGCLSAYAGACAPEALRERILRVCSFDGPGLSDEVMASEGYAAIRPKILSVIPQSSVVGLLLDYHTDYTVVHSVNNGILQHDSFSWQMENPFTFTPEADIDDSSRIMKEGMHNWLKVCSAEQRRAFTDALFETIGATDAHTTR